MDTRNTEQKQIILNAFQKNHHYTADELLKRIRVTYPKFSRATLYRNLANFTCMRTVKKIAICGGADRFELADEFHYHLICEKCGKLEDLILPKPLSTPDSLMGYKITRHELTFFGICPKCLAKQQKLGK